MKHGLRCDQLALPFFCLLMFTTVSAGRNQQYSAGCFVYVLLHGELGKEADRLLDEMLYTNTITSESKDLIPLPKSFPLLSHMVAPLFLPCGHIMMRLNVSVTALVATT